MKGKYDGKKERAANRMIQNELLNIANNMKKRLADTKNFLKKERDPEKIKEYSEVGGAVFITPIGATCFMYLSGQLQERYGPGRLAFIGSVMCGGRAIYLSQSGNMAEFNLWAFMVGASTAFIYLLG
jgi:hypothetical protein